MAAARAIFAAVAADSATRRAAVASTSRQASACVTTTWTRVAAFRSLAALEAAAATHC